MPLAAGTKLDGYEVLGLLGAGGMGEVYRARDPALKREVAIKVLPSFVSQDSDRLHRFKQEAQAAAALNHPNILAVYQFGVFGGAPYSGARHIWYPNCLRATRCANCCSAARCRFAKQSITASRSLMD
jgi:serine/threonine protein kinase